MAKRVCHTKSISVMNGMNEMKLLLDTCALIWWTLDQPQFSQETLAILNTSDELYLSSISIWDVGIKIKNKKIDIGMSIQNYVEKLKDLRNIACKDNVLCLTGLHSYANHTYGQALERIVKLFMRNKRKRIVLTGNSCNIDSINNQAANKISYYGYKF